MLEKNLFVILSSNPCRSGIASLLPSKLHKVNWCYCHHSRLPESHSFRFVKNSEMLKRIIKYDIGILLNTTKQPTIKYKKHS